MVTMVTLKDVGELAGVTATTASAALRGKDYVKPETTQRVCDAARKLGYKNQPVWPVPAFWAVRYHHLPYLGPRGRLFLPSGHVCG